MRIWLSTAMLLLLPATWAYSATLCVNPGGTGGCFDSLQAAVDASAKNDEIEVRAGVYGDPATIPTSARLTVRGEGLGASVLEAGLTIGERARVTLSDVTVRNAPDHCVRAEAKSRVEIADSLVHGCGDSGIWGDDKVRLTVVRSTIRDCVNDGVQGARTVTVQDSTISGNGRWGLTHNAKLRVENSTISGNQLVGVQVDRKAQIYGSTIAANGTGLSLGADRKAKLANVLLADNGTDCSKHPFTAKVISKGYNLIEDLGDCTLSGTTAGNIIGLDPGLGPLEANGGPTDTHALGGGSPAIDAGSPKPPGNGTRCRPADQRGVPRVGPCDIGAYEFP